MGGYQHLYCRHHHTGHCRKFADNRIHAQGPSVSAFFGLIFSLPQLLDWLVLALAVTVVMTCRKNRFVALRGI